MDEHIERPALRPARIAEYPLGRKRLSPRWWKDPNLEPGTTLLAREEHRRRRAARPLKHPPDVVTQKSERSYARWLWEYEPTGLCWISDAQH